MKDVDEDIDEIFSSAVSITGIVSKENKYSIAGRRV